MASAFFQKMFSRGATNASPNGTGVLPVKEFTVPEWGNQSGRFPFPMYIKYKGLMDLDGIYKFMALWLKKRRYEFHETLYKFKPPELELVWLAERKKTGFAKDIIHVHLHMWGEYDLEVEVKGKKKKMAKARMIITLNAETEGPYDDPFGQRRWNLPMERRLLNIFHRYIFKREFELLNQDALYYELNRFHVELKEYMKLSARGISY